MKIHSILLVMILALTACQNSDKDASPANTNPQLPETQIKGQARLLFVDMTSAPNSGWGNNSNKGAAITVWGIGLGKSRGDSYITVGGVKLTADSDYGRWGEAWPTPFWSRVTFWLNDGMHAGNSDITITVNGKTSNPLPFTIREGRILFISASGINGNGSLSSPFNYTQAGGHGIGYVDDMLAGDIYYFRGGNYDKKVNEGNSILWLRHTEAVGTEQQPIAMIAYPGEKPVFTIPTYNTNLNKGIRLSNKYNVFSGFKIDSEWMTADLSGSYHRLIGNDLIGLKNFYGGGTGIVTTGGSGNKILGNAIHGGNSKDRFDHATYFSGCAYEEGSHLGWNYVFNNDFGRGPELAINHQENRCEPDNPQQIIKAHFVFNNIVDCSPQRAVALNVYDLSYDTGEIAPEPTYVYNNLFLNCGTLDTVNTNHIGWAPALIANTAHTRFYNNVLYNTHYLGFQISGGVLSSRFQNNILVMNSSSVLDNDRADIYLQNDAPDKSIVSNNLFFDMGDSAMNTQHIDTQTNMMEQDPLFVNPDQLDFSLQADSPAFDAGTSDLLFEVPAPDYAPINRDITFLIREGAYDLGLFEYIE